MNRLSAFFKVGNCQVRGSNPCAGRLLIRCNFTASVLLTAARAAHVAGIPRLLLVFAATRSRNSSSSITSFKPGRNLLM